jgi:hypothetical protein
MQKQVVCVLTQTSSNLMYGLRFCQGILSSTLFQNCSTVDNFDSEGQGSQFSSCMKIKGASLFSEM